MIVPETLMAQDRLPPAMEVIDEHACCRLLFEEWQPRNGLLVGCDCIARAVASEQQPEPESRIDSFPECNVDDFLNRLIGGLICWSCAHAVGSHRVCLEGWMRGGDGVVAGRLRNGMRDRSQSERHFSRFDRGAEIHPTRSHVPLIDERPSCFAARCNGVFVERVAGGQRQVRQIAMQRNPQ